MTLRRWIAGCVLLCLVAAAILYYSAAQAATVWTFPSGLALTSWTTPSPIPSPAPTAANGYYEGQANCHRAPTLPDTSGSKQQYADYIVNTIAPRYHLEAAMLLWQVHQESGFNPNASSSAGAVGIAQFMPATAAAYHLNPWDPWQSLDGLARYDLASLHAFWDWSGTIATRFGGNRNAYAWGMALAAYNAGGPNMGRALGWADQHHWSRGPWTWLWWFGDTNQTFYYVPDILGCLATT